MKTPYSLALEIASGAHLSHREFAKLASIIRNDPEPMKKYFELQRLKKSELVELLKPT